MIGRPRKQEVVWEVQPDPGFDEALDGDQLDAIRAHLQRQHALGSERFRVAIETPLNRRAGPAKIGRPRKANADLKSAT
jgi:hypothetical protein